MSAAVGPILNDLSFCRGFWPEHVARLASMASEVHFQPGELIFHEGDRSSFFYLLVSGNVALEVVPPGRPVRVATLVAGEVLGWSSLTGDTWQAIPGARAGRGPRAGFRWRPVAACLREPTSRSGSF